MENLDVDLFDPEKIKNGQLESEELIKKIKIGKTPSELQFDLVKIKRIGEKIENV